MGNQLWLSGFTGSTPRPRPHHALFFAVCPPPEIATRIAVVTDGFCRQHGLRGKRIDAERLHMTLLPLGMTDCPQDVAAIGRVAAARVARPTFAVGLDWAMSFHGEHGNWALVLCGDDGVTGLIALQEALGTAMRGLGLGRLVSQRRTPHMTLHYGNSKITGQAIETIRWTVPEFVLIHSLVGQARHIRVGQWVLG